MICVRKPDMEKQRLREKENNQTGRKNVELLAPAGNYECFLAAVNAGADAVYLAGEKFGARAYADNFSEEEVVRAIRYAHLFSRKVYLTVNTLFKDGEIGQLADFLRPYVHAGLDAVIVQDLGVLSLIRREFPNLAIHCSTQMTITGSGGLRFAKELGAVRVVPARELSLDEIRQMKADCPDMELECFIHGAMCYCYSGQCLMSSLIGGRSGNRGTCAQPCRLPYDVLFQDRPSSAKKNAAGRQCYPLSLKDMAALSLIPELIEAGIDLLKIEGRMKRAEYCAGVTAVYRSVIDRYLDDPVHFTGPTKEESDLLRGLYIRTEIGEGYYHCYNGKHMLTPDKPSYRGCEESVLDQIRERYMTHSETISVDMTICLDAGKPASLILSNDQISAEYRGALVEDAVNKPLADEAICGQLRKTGGTPFTAGEIQIQKSGDIFMPIRALNELRREGLLLFENRLLEQAALEQSASRNTSMFEKKNAWEEQGSLRSARRPRRGFTVAVGTEEQLDVCMRHPLADRICVDPYVYEAYRKKGGAPKETEREIDLWMPRIFRKKDIPAMTQLVTKLVEQGEPVKGIYIHTPDEYDWAVSVASRLRIDPQEWIIGSPFLYVMNREAARFWNERIRAVTLSYELREQEIRALLAAASQSGIKGFEMPVYGHIPMMVTANCLADSFGQCTHKSETIMLKDRTGLEMPVENQCRYCINVIYNGIVLSLHRHMPKLRSLYQQDQIDSFALYFTVEDRERTKAVLDFYENSERGSWPFGAYTNGHYQRGVV